MKVKFLFQKDFILVLIISRVLFLIGKYISICIGSTTSIIAEFWALRDGLQLAIQLGVQYLEVELDAKVVLHVISSGKSPTAAYSSLLFDCKLLLEKIPHYTVKHVFRGANRRANALARMGCNL